MLESEGKIREKPAGSSEAYKDFLWGTHRG